MLKPALSLRIAGILFIAAFFLYGGGNALFDSVIASPEGGRAVLQSPMIPAAAGFFMLLNSIAVAGIGALFFPFLQQFDPATAALYLAGRLFESVLMSVGIILLLLHIPMVAGISDPTLYSTNSALLVKGNMYAYQSAMMVLSISGIMFCLSLYRHEVIPHWLGLWGVAGYSVFLIGSSAEIFGLSWGLAAAVPGGLFELVFGVRLIYQGLEIPKTQGN